MTPGPQHCSTLEAYRQPVTHNYCTTDHINRRSCHISGLLPRRFGFEPRSGNVGFVEDKNGTGAGPLRVPLASYSGGTGSSPSQEIWGLWWTKWHWGRFCTRTSGFSQRGLGFEARSGNVGFVWTKWHWASFLQVLLFNLPVPNLPTAPSSSSITWRQTRGDRRIKCTLSHPSSVETH
jgi:hypothetical protein